MPKENTHLYFADHIKKTTPELSQIINHHLQCFYLGSIFPDTFFYSNKKDIQDISAFIHGMHGAPTNTIIFQLLDLAKEHNDDELLVFVFGFLTHCYLDIVFHPIIFYLSGNFYDCDTYKRELAIYQHRRLEVSLDQKLNKGYYFEKLIDRNLFHDTGLLQYLSKILQIDPNDVQLSFKRQFRLNTWFRKTALGSFLYFLNKIHLLHNKSDIALFYGHFPDDEHLSDHIEYKDLFTGHTYTTDIDSLFVLATQKTQSALLSAYRYYKGRETRKDAEIAIAGENLDTGDKNFGVDKIKFLKTGKSVRKN